MDQFPKDGQPVLLVLCIPGSRVAQVLFEALDYLCLSCLDRIFERRGNLVSHLTLIVLDPIVVFKSLKSELSQELKELVIVLRGWYLVDSRVEVVNIADFNARHKILNSAVDYSDHFCMLALLAFPEKINGLLG